MSRPTRILLVTGMSGAGRTTALKTLEDIGWETVDNLPLSLVDRLLSAPLPEGTTDGARPLAVGIDTRTRGFDAEDIARRIDKLREKHAVEIAFFDCSAPILAQRFSATRRRHPLALDRPAADGIERERELLRPLRDASDHLIDTSDLTSNALQHELRERFGDPSPSPTPTLLVTSFGYGRGLPRNADLVFDMRFLRNPHWIEALRPGTGLDQPVADYIAADDAYEPALSRIEELLLALLPRYHDEGKSYVTLAFGCTGGRHRSVHVAERIASRLRAAGFSPSIVHRELAREMPAIQETRPGDGEGQS